MTQTTLLGAFRSDCFWKAMELWGSLMGQDSAHQDLTMILTLKGLKMMTTWSRKCMIVH